MFRKIAWIFILILLVELQPDVPFGITYGGSSSEDNSNKTDSTLTIAIVGDLQRTSLMEKVIFREQNDIERNLIAQSISRENISSVVLLGDMVFDGSSEADWRECDKLLSPIRKNGINIYPVLGNHEYWGNNITALSNVCARFPQISQKHWYYKKQGKVGLIFLDSNKDEMTPSLWKEQEDWFHETVTTLEKDSTILSFVVFTHHPPYTNSTVTGDEKDVQEAFLPDFYNSQKGILFFSGHAHTYERFYIAGKTFIVSGGGGGPRVDLNIGPDYHQDLFEGKVPRPFHYILLSQNNAGITLTVKGLNKGTTNFFVMDKLSLPFYQLTASHSN